MDISLAAVIWLAENHIAGLFYMKKGRGENRKIWEEIRGLGGEGLYAPDQEYSNIFSIEVGLK